ncbi:MAG: hypothetical protein AAGA42_18935 [Actinomycetota bacterium]
MGSWSSPERRRVFVPQALGADEYLRVTWHEGRNVMVFSHWDGADCIAATPVRVTDLGELVSLVTTAFVDAVDDHIRPGELWAPPLAAAVVDTSPPTAITA